MLKLSVFIKIPVAVIVPPGFGLFHNVDFFGMLKPHTINVIGDLLNYWFKNFDAWNRVSIDVFKKRDDFFDKRTFFITILDQGSFLDLYIFLDNEDVDWYKSMIWNKSPIRVNMVVVKLLRIWA